MSNLTILTMDEIADRNQQLEIFRKRGTKATISDFAMLLGGQVSNYNYKLKKRTGSYWTDTGYDIYNGYRKPTKIESLYTVDSDGEIHDNEVYTRNIGCRPVLPYSTISSICSNKVRTQDGILEVEYGEYPQEAVSKTLQKILEEEYQKNSLLATGKEYTINFAKYYEYNKPFQEQKLTEYEYNEKKYVRVKANTCFNSSYHFTLSNRKKYRNGDYIWVEVQPIKWWINEKSDLAVAEKVLFAGIEFNHNRNYDGNFNNTTLKKFMDNYLSKDIIPSQQVNYHLQRDFKNLNIQDANITYKPGIHINFPFPVTDLENVETVTIESVDSEGKPKIYTFTKK